ARPSMAGHSAGRAAVPRSLRLMHSTAVHGVTTPAPDTPARPSLAGRSPLLWHAPISRTRYMAPAVHGRSPRAPETPARPSMAGRSPLLWHAPISRTRYMAPAVHGGSPRAPETPARPSMAGRSAGRAAVPRSAALDTWRCRPWRDPVGSGGPCPAIPGRAFAPFAACRKRGSPPRVVPGVQALQVLARDQGVDLGGGRAGVAQQQLQRAQGGAVVAQAGGGGGA